MTIAINHAKTNAITDWTQPQLDTIIAGGAPPLPPPGTTLSQVVLPSDWNVGLTTSMATGRLLGRTTAGTGVFEEITPNSTVSLTAGGIGLDLTNANTWAGITTFSNATDSTVFTNGAVVLSNGGLGVAGQIRSGSSITAATTITAGGGTVVASSPVLNATQTWNNAGVAFTGVLLNVTNTASAAGSLLMDLQVGGGSIISIRKDGVVTGPSAFDSTAASGFAFRAAIGGKIGWNLASLMNSPSDGVITLSNNAITDFSRLQFGGTTASFPSIKRNATALNFRLADDSAACPITSSTLTTSGNVAVGTTTTTNGYLTVTGATTLYTDPANTGTAAFRITDGTGAVTDNTLSMGVNTAGPYAYIQSVKAGTGFLKLFLNAGGGNVAIGNATATSMFSLGTSEQFQINSSGKHVAYNGVATTAWGAPAIYGSGRSTAQVAAVASVATYTVGAADGSFIISANVLLTVSVTNNFTVTVSYNDENNNARTATLTFSQLNGTLLTAITNVTGVAPYEGIPLHIRCKAATAITIATTGTFTSCTYNVEGYITQIG